MKDPPVDAGAYDYHLPEERIAQWPATLRDRSRLLVMDRRVGSLDHRVFKDLP
ncbi:MAG: S-adenosylmethionine:tRNA ribosyltransferase-isomerase, partial [Candidatus Eisenbacteria bacterium]|nr:S-adenosylmethionine:tRNA ribosyltransferase-isomerase [Candidatus Eisenbacteria bacterium]